MQGSGVNVITELIIGYLYPGKPLANVAFKTYGTISLAQALNFLADFKLGHYMKIPPKSMFIVQVKCCGCMMIPPKSMFIRYISYSMKTAFFLINK